MSPLSSATPTDWKPAAAITRGDAGAETDHQRLPACRGVQQRREAEAHLRLHLAATASLPWNCRW